MELSRKAQAIEPSLTLAITAKAKEMKEKGIDVMQENQILIHLKI